MTSKNFLYATIIEIILECYLSSFIFDFEKRK